MLAALLTTATVVTLVLGWFGWRMLQQESAVQRERRRERLESGADAMAAKSRTELWTYPFPGGQPSRQRMADMYRGLWISPDGKELASIKFEHFQQVLALDNFLPAAK